VRHDFNERQNFARSPLAREYMDLACRDYWPALLAMSVNDADNAAQRSGTDRVIVLSSTESLRIEEKIREGYWRDVLLEYLSNSRTNAPGWIAKDNSSHYLMYALPDVGRYWMLPWETLRKTWQRLGTTWIDWGVRRVGGFKIIESETPTPYGVYKSQSVAVPEHVMIAEFGRTCLREFRVGRPTGGGGGPGGGALKPLVSLRPVSPQLDLDLGGGRRR
jgi:hypothetical protein